MNDGAWWPQPRITGRHVAVPRRGRARALCARILCRCTGRKSLQFYTFDAIAMSLTILVVIRMILGLGPAAQPQQR